MCRCPICGGVTGRLEARTSFGRIKSHRPIKIVETSRHEQSTVPDKEGNGPRLNLRTNEGEIEIRQAGTARSTGAALCWKSSALLPLRARTPAGGTSASR